MSLTQAQFDALKSSIISDPTAGPIRQSGDSVTLGQWVNGPSGNSAWKANVPASDSDQAATYTTYDSLTQGKRDSWSIFLMFSRDFTRSKIRKWVTDVWGAGAITDAVLTSGTEVATRAQNILGGTSRTEGGVTALNRNYDGIVDTSELARLVN